MKTLVMFVALVLVSSSAFGVTLFSDDFESGNLDQWQTYYGYPIAELTGDQAHSGSSSIRITQMNQRVGHDFVSSMENVNVSWWFYDNLDLNSYFVSALFENNSWGDPYTTVAATDVDANYMVALTRDLRDTTIPRSLGWHKVLMQVRPEGTIVSLDGGLSFIEPDVPSFTRLYFAEPNYDSGNGTFYIDDVLITDLDGPDPPGGGDLPGGPVPEPTTLSLVGVGFFLIRRRRR